jgi:hypothetical protein
MNRAEMMKFIICYEFYQSVIPLTNFLLIIAEAPRSKYIKRLPSNYTTVNTKLLQYNIKPVMEA